MRIGMLTGGGDCPGLNAVIRAVVHTCRSLTATSHRFPGRLAGAARGHVTAARTSPTSRGILAAGRHDPRLVAHEPLQGRGWRRHDQRDLADQGVDALVAIGGEDTLGVAERLTDDGVGVVGVPKTIDNDLGATDYTFGFDTAVHIATEAIDRLRTTAESHHRALVVEVMGRHAGWIALHSGLAGGANVILVPERPFSVDQVSTG